MAAREEPSFYVLGDEQMNAMATAAPLRVPRRGKADIGGRMRVAQILRNAGIGSPVMPERVAGSTNEVWRSGDLVVRVGFVPGANRLRREAQLVPLLPREVGYPKVLASGSEAFGEWIIVRHLPGDVLSQAWMYMDGPQRQAAVHDFAEMLKVVHDVKFTPEQRDTLEFQEGEGELALPHALPAERILEQLHRALDLPHMDRGLIHAAMDRTKEVADTMWAHERFGLIHGDLHFENVLIKDGVIVALLDFEWARFGPRVIDLDVLARFCANPGLHIGGNYPVRREDFTDVLRWTAEVYPELFEDPFLCDRLTLCGLAFEVPWLLKTPPSGPMSDLPEFHPIHELKDLLEKGSHAERLGWAPRDAYYY